MTANFSLLAILTFFCVLSSINAEIPWPAKEGWVTQRIDHFNFASWVGQTYQQRYLYEDKYWDKKGPIFFYCGNEGSIEAFWNNTGFMFEIAPAFKALIIFGEHRYYGKSLPFNDLEKTFQQPYIQFLSIQQALEDFSLMIPSLKETFKATDSPVIAFGGSYGGILAAYMRVKYPHIVHGAVASSAPVYWTVGLKNIHGFFEDTTKDFDEADAKCVPTLKNAYKTIESKRYSTSGLTEISQELNLCETLLHPEDVDWMLRWSRNAFVMMSMMDYPYPSEFMAPLPGNPVNESCARALKANSPMAALREAVSVMYPRDPKGNCYSYKDQYIPCADITGCGLGPDAWAWDFQSCTQIHLFDPSSHTDKDMFPDLPLTLEDVAKYCETTWGVHRSETEIITSFGPDVWKHTSNIVFPNGRRDPWMNGGITESPSRSVKAVVIDGGAHHLDLRAANDLDPQSVKDARTLIVMEISNWIREKQGKGPTDLGTLLLKQLERASALGKAFPNAPKLAVDID